jgi:hypothetical protein
LDLKVTFELRANVAVYFGELCDVKVESHIERLVLDVGLVFLIYIVEWNVLSSEERFELRRSNELRLLQGGLSVFQLLNLFLLQVLITIEAVFDKY